MPSTLPLLGDLCGQDLAHGDAGPGVVVAAGVPEVTLAPAQSIDFGSSLPSPGWLTESCGERGSVEIEQGRARLQGARIGTEALFQGNRALEFRATFAARPDQHVGFGLDCEHVPWLTFSSKWGRQLYARSHFVVSEDKRIKGPWLGSSHHFRINWRVLDVVFEIDTEPVARLLVPMPPLMRPLAANMRTTGDPLIVEWMRMSPYAPAGRFVSRVIDAGAEVRWGDMAPDVLVPDSTGLRLGVRTGDSPVPDRDWSAWRDPGSLPGTATRYLQYRADLSTDDLAATPVLRGMRIEATTLGQGR